MFKEFLKNNFFVLLFSFLVLFVVTTLISIPTANSFSIWLHNFYVLCVLITVVCGILSLLSLFYTRQI